MKCRFVIRRLAISVVVVYALVALLLWQFQAYLLFPALAVHMPSAPEPPAWIESFFVTTPDNEKLEVWTTFGKSSELTSPYVALIFHGNGETVAMKNFLPFFARHHIPAFTFDYRGYGRSSGWPTKTNMLNDAETVWNAIQQKTGVSAERAIILGNSIGSGPATYLAAKINPRALILIAGYASVAEILADYLFYRPFIWLLQYNFENSAPLSTLKARCVIAAHGRRDEIINFRHLELIKKSINAAAVKIPIFLENDDASHNDIYYKVEAQLDQNLDRCLAD